MYPQAQDTVPLGTITGAVNDLDVSKGNVFTATLGGNVSVAIKSLRPGQRLTVILTQDGAGARTVSWAGAGGQTVARAAAAQLVPSGGAALLSVFDFVGIDATNVQLVVSSLGA